MNAEDHMVIAERYIKECRRNQYNMDKLLSQATEHIEAARKINPAANVKIDDVHHTINDLVAESLALQAQIDCKTGIYKKQVRRGLKAADEALKYWPFYAEIYVTKAIGLKRLGRHREAQKMLDVAIEKNPRHFLAHELRNGTTDAGTPAADSMWFGPDFFKDILTDWRFLSILALFFIWPGYCVYRVYTGLQTGDPDTAYYFWWAVVMIGAPIGLNVLKEWWERQ
ncbi:hypothetical protein [Bradyrhizobium sp. ORS 285]|uniref:hypothetical protein n=1 Tax=Bradyrhizobium sp. ORS 285 TaxID=115808 RepID=UPI0012FAFE35|nr:hypothetical protein [Bradyrhizobium sp. ORS 285]